MNRSFLIDAAERVGWTALQAFAAAYLATAFGVIDTNFLESLQIAGLAALLAACKAIVAMKVGDSSTAQALPGVESTYTNTPAKA